MNEAASSEAGHSSLSNNPLHIDSKQVTRTTRQSSASPEVPAVSGTSENKQQVTDTTTRSSSYLQVPPVNLNESPYTNTAVKEVSQGPNPSSTSLLPTATKTLDNSIIRSALNTRSKKPPKTELETEKPVTKDKTQTATEKTEESETAKEKTNSQQEKQPGFNMCFVVTFILCLTLQFCAYGRLLKIPKEKPKVGKKWDPRKDLKIPVSVPFTHIPDGDISKLEEVITQHYLTVAVLYAPWSRSSLRVIDYFSELAPNWQDADIEFVAMNCWIKGTNCNDNYNSWDFPQVLIYHKDIDYIPYIYSLSTYSSAFATELERLYEPVLYVDSLTDLTNILVKHQRSVIGLFSGYEENEDYKEFLKAAIIHHLEYMDSYYVPFIVLSTRHVTVLESAQLKTLVYKYVLFETLSPFQGRHHKLLHRELLNWLKVKSDKLSIRYLGHQGFNALARNNNVSVIFASPLHQNSANFVSYMRSIMSYRHCNTEPELKIHCKPNMTCLNPCLPDTTLSRDTILPCFFPSFQTPNYVQQCYFNRQRTSLLPSPFPTATSKMSEDLTVLTQHTFLESEVMCSESYEDKCTQCTEVEQLHSDLEFSISRAANLHHTSYQGEGCEGNNVVFYALDTVIWADMISHFGVNNTDRQFTEAIIKVDSEGRNVFTIDLTNNSLNDDDKFWTLINGHEKENEKYLQNPSGRNEKNSESLTEEDSDVQKEYVHEISRLDLLSIENDRTQDYVVFAYTKWCGYCQILRRKVEAAARLLSAHPSLTFVAIDTDKNNNLRDCRISIKSVPSVHLFLQTSGSPVMFEHAPHKPASVKDLVKFIKKHASDTNPPAHNSFNSRSASPPAIPCSTWTPAPAPPHQPTTDELNLAHAQTSPIDEILEGKGDLDEQGPLQQKLEELLSELPNKATDNFPNAVFDSMTFKEDSPVLKSKDSLCRSVIHLFKSLSIGSGIHPYKLNSITATLIRDLHENSCFASDPDCLTGEKSNCFMTDVKDFWSWVGSGCFRGSWEKLPCKFLLVASEIASMCDVVPIDIQLILEAKKHSVDKRLERKISRAKKLGLPMPNSAVEEFERFHIEHCYNFKVEFLFHLKQTCSYLCRLTCRVIHKFHTI